MMDSQGRAQSGLERALDPGVVKRSMFACKMDATFRFDKLRFNYQVQL
jgi:hypothetical protein